MAVVEDVKALISCGRPAVVCTVTDLRQLFAAAMEEAKGSKQPGSRNGQQQAQSQGVTDPVYLSSPQVVGQGKRQAASEGTARQKHQVQQQHAEGGTEDADATGGVSEQSKSSATGPSGYVRSSSRKKLRQQLQAAERRLVYFQSWANEQTRDQYQHILEAIAEASRVFERAQDMLDVPVGKLAEIGNGQAARASKAEAHQASGRTLLQKPLVQQYDGSSDEVGLRADPSRDSAHGQERAEMGTEYDTLD